MLSFPLSRKSQVVFYPWMSHTWNFSVMISVWTSNSSLDPQILKDKMTKDL